MYLLSSLIVFWLNLSSLKYESFTKIRPNFRKQIIWKLEVHIFWEVRKNLPNSFDCSYWPSQIYEPYPKMILVKSFSTNLKCSIEKKIWMIQLIHLENWLWKLNFESFWPNLLKLNKKTRLRSKVLSAREYIS